MELPRETMPSQVEVTRGSGLVWTVRPVAGAPSFARLQPRSSKIFSSSVNWEYNSEQADIPAEQSPSQPQARFPPPYAHPCRTFYHFGPPQSGSQGPLGLNHCAAAERLRSNGCAKGTARSPLRNPA